MKVWLTQTEITANNLATKIRAKSMIMPVLISKALPKKNLIINDNTWLIITSITAISYWYLPKPKNIVVMGQASADYAKAQGFIEPIVAPGQGSESLLKNVKIPKHAEIIVASATSRRGLLEPELSRQGYQVTSLDLYENLANRTNIAVIAEQIAETDLIVVASQQAIELLLPLLKQKPITWLTLPRLASSLKNQVNGKILVANDSYGLAELANKCYLEG